MSDAQEPIEQVIRYARQNGHKLTRAQLRRYQQHGVIGSPKLIGLGRGRGTRVAYPSGTGQQLVAACEALRQNRSFRVARWKLWWTGLAVNTAQIRRALDQYLKINPKNERLPREMRRRLHGAAQQRRVKRFTQQITEGKFEGFSEPLDEKLFARAMKLPPQIVADMKAPDYWPTSGMGNFFRMFSQALGSTKVKESLLDSTDSDLQATRDEVRRFLNNAHKLGNLLDSIGPSGLGNIFRKMTELSVSEQQAALLAWLCARRYQAVHGTYEALMLFLSGGLLELEKQNVETEQ